MLMSLRLCEFPVMCFPVTKKYSTICMKFFSPRKISTLPNHCISFFTTVENISGSRTTTKVVVLFFSIFG